MGALLDTTARIERVAALLYESFTSGAYARSWATAPDKRRWRQAAEAVLQALEEEE